MSPQHDYIIDNSTGANVRSDINSALQAIATNNSGSSAPSTTFASQFFADTNAGIMKLRNTSNNGYVNLFTLAGGIDVDAASTFSEDVTFEGASANIKFDKSDNALEFRDNMKAKFGDGDDLSIFHNGSHSIIAETGTGNLQIRCADFRVTNADNSETIIAGNTNGAVELYHDNSKKLETRSNGIEVLGHVLLADNNRIGLGNVGSNGDLQLFHDGTHSRIHNSTGSLFVRANDGFGIFSGDGSETLFVVNTNGAGELYFDNSKKFETTSAGTKISGDGLALTIQGVDGDTFMKILGNTNVNVILGHLSDQGFVGNSTNHDFFIRTNNTNRISISNSGTLSGDLNDTSDKNLKENIVSIPDGEISNIKKLRPVNYDWKDSEKAKNQSGFIAQEVKTIFPNLVVGEEYDESKTDLGYAINTSGVVAHLTKALQEAIAKVETLETKVAALEAA